MNRNLIAATVLAALSATAQAHLPVGSASLMPSTVHMTSSRFTTSIQGAAGTTFVVIASRDEEFHGFRVLGRAPLDGAGDGTFAIDMSDERALPRNFRVYFRAAYLSDSGIEFTPAKSVLFNPTPVESLDFTWALGGDRIEPGEVLAEQWIRRGIEISAESFNPNVRSIGIALDSRNPGNAEQDLRTPGRGLGNDRELLNLLVVAGDATDRNQDQRVDRPIAADRGGKLVFDFDRPTFLDRMTLVDADAAGGRLRCLSHGVLLGELPIPTGGDNSVQTVGFPFEAVTRLEVELSSGAGIAELTYLPCPEVIDFDRTMTGTPVDLAPGEAVRHQLGDYHAVRFSARTNNPHNEGLAVIVPRPEVAYSSDTRRRLYEENVLVIAKNTADRNQDGYVDRPASEPMGGVIVMDFDTNVRWNSARVADVNCGETSYFVAENARGEVIGVFPLAGFGDNVVQTVQPELGQVRRIRLHLGGTAALVDLSFCSEDEFPRLTFEAPGCPPSGSQHGSPPQ